MLILIAKVLSLGMMLASLNMRLGLVKNDFDWDDFRDPIVLIMLLLD